MSAEFSRRAFLVTAASAALAGCASARPGMPQMMAPTVDPQFVAMYGARPDERFPIPAIDVTRIDPQLFRQEVAYDSFERPGTIVVDPGARFLYLVRENGRAMRYGVGVGRAGYDYQGDAIIQRKAEWPRWTPTATMIAEDPERNLPFAGGMEPGLKNPLGARALYLFKNGVDTLYRIHGTNDPLSIGKSLSSGCVRLFNQDIIDLHQRVPNGTRVVVLPTGMV
ncbi:L,D-transpeptidase [Methylobrevis albus]|uniref:L,D-transpeptidase n=1 Tax=Methylobrevis albus TaxID=2793297 RepID=A0A931HYB4_9HYPH|nr:L,D-transpeptidase [Methylobrevis albus]MBH0236325.1 L,D-transpeptidase [Methylobrevis albus]